jgi:hypothetical protein
MPDAEGLSPDAQDLLAELRQAQLVRRDQGDLRAALLKVRPQLETDPEKDVVLERLLAELEGTGMLRAHAGPRTNGLPRSVALAFERPTRTALVPGNTLPPLHRRLRAARDVTNWRADEVTVLSIVSRFLASSSPETPEVARRERSYELFGDEKALDRLQKARLGRLDLVSDELLRCVDTPLPFAWVRVSGRSDAALLIVENSATFDSIATVLDGSSSPRYDVIVSGGGQTILRTLPFALRLAAHAGIARVRAMAYFGDLDPPGLQIAMGAVRVASEAGLPTLGAAEELYLALANANPAPFDKRHKPYTEEQLDWLPTAVAARAQAAFEAGRRFPQEALDRQALRSLLRA